MKSPSAFYLYVHRLLFYGPMGVVLPIVVSWKSYRSPAQLAFFIALMVLMTTWYIFSEILGGRIIMGVVMASDAILNNLK